MTLIGLRDLENEVSVVPLCTKFSETASNISSDIKWEQFYMNLNDFPDLENKFKVMRFQLDLFLTLGLCVPNLVRLC